MNSVCEVKNLSKNHDKEIILDDLSYTFKNGQIYCIVGESGAGKTTLLRLIASLDKEYSGNICFSFESQTSLNISYAFQSNVLFPWLNVWENLLICLENHSQEKINLLNELLAKTGLENHKNSYPGQLSGGMVQKVNVIRAFMNDSELILMDEPFSSLDFFQRKELQDLTIMFQSEFKKTIIFVTHNLHEALRLANRVLLLSRNGKKFTKEYVNNRDENLELSIEYSNLYKEILNDIRELHE